MTALPLFPPSLSARTVLGLALVAAADLLLFDHPPGVSAALFVVCVATASVASNKASPRRLALPALLVLAAFAALAENVSALSVAVATLLIAAFALALTGRLASTPAAILERLAVFFVAAPLRLASDMLARARAARRMRSGRGRYFDRLAGWIMPAGLALVFAGLFGIANPVFDRWLALLDPLAWLEALEFERTAFWLLVFLAVWPFLRPRLPKRLARLLAKGRRMLVPSRPAAPVPDDLAELLFGRAAKLRALVVFNALFAVQTLLDATYLWGGVALPDGMSYASYAHRGAYPLVATALLAAVFVLVAMRPGSASATDARLRRLVYLWTAQTVALVASSILRLDLYVDAYSLTYWRVAAFVWMALVAAGLVFIALRIALRRSNRWLLDVNIVLAAAVLYASCFVNFAALIANYNVSHSTLLGGDGANLDVWYLVSLGPEAIPAIDRIAASPPGVDGALPSWLPEQRSSLAHRHHGEMTDWRAWTLRGLRLSRYLDGREPVSPAAAPEPGVPQPARTAE